MLQRSNFSRSENYVCMLPWNVSVREQSLLLDVQNEENIKCYDWISSLSITQVKRGR